MKIRTGFVSNSSSSSFCLFASKEAFTKALQSCSDVEKRIISEFTEQKKFMGKEIWKYSYLSGNYGDYYTDRVREIAESYLEENPNAEIDQDYLMDFAFGNFENKLKQIADGMHEGILTDSQEF